MIKSKTELETGTMFKIAVKTALEIGAQEESRKYETAAIISTIIKSGFNTDALREELQKELNLLEKKIIILDQADIWTAHTRQAEQIFSTIATLAQEPGQQLPPAEKK